MFNFKLDTLEANEILKFKIPDINLIPERLPNLNKATNFRNFGYSNYPSYLNSKDNE